MRLETETAIRAVTNAIKIADSREGAETVTSKGGIDLVTHTDILCEDSIRAELTQAFPDYPIVGEERGGTPIAGRPYWLVDPICGTRPYASDVPLYCTNVALVENNTVTLAAVGLGNNGETVYAEQGMRAHVRKNGVDRKIAVTDSSNTLWLGGRGQHSADLVRAAMLSKRWYIWQFSSSIAYPYVAAGRIAGLVHFSEHLSSVHTAAGCFIAAAAGAIVTDIDGRPWNLENRSYVLASTPALHNDLLDLIANSR
ncbi:MAG: hypothetical protein HW386_1543 [Gammaproteobacteria bacterium]|nr:hypothetical protein [Gammaproteobacteria bacterium]